MAEKWCVWKILMKKCLIMVTRIIKWSFIHVILLATVIYKIAYQIKTVWQILLKFQIYIFGVMILQMKYKTKFWKIWPCNFKLIKCAKVSNLYYVSVFWAFQMHSIKQTQQLANVLGNDISCKRFLSFLTL